MPEQIDLTAYRFQAMPDSSRCPCGGRCLLAVRSGGFLAGPRYIVCFDCQRIGKQADDGTGGVVRHSDPEVLTEQQRRKVEEWDAAR